MACNSNERDPFERYPIRTAKGGGTKCTTCEVHLNCHECCACVPERVCISFDLDCEFIEVDHDPLDTPGEAHWNCIYNRYELSASCDGEPFLIWVYYEKDSYDVCYAVLESEFLGAVGPYRPRVALTEGQNCRCPNYDFQLHRSDTEFVFVRQWDSISVGNIRCIDRGPDDCTGCRCMPRCLCGTIETVANPLGDRFELCWYEDGYYEVACCCNGNLFPEVLIARVVSLNDQCFCAVPPYAQATDTTGHGHTINAPGPIINLFHEIIDGNHAWKGETSFCGATSSTLRVTLTCTGTTWLGTVEIFGPGGLNVYEPEPIILSCNPFHLRLPSISDDEYCATISNGPAEGSLFHIDIQEFRGWVGMLPDGRNLSMYFEHVPVADEPQKNVADCMVKLHFSDGAEPHTLKGNCDTFTTDLLCLSGFPISFLAEDVDDPLTDCHSISSTIILEAKGCRDCGIVTPDPYFVQTVCCANRVPRTLYLSGVTDNDCPCADSVALTLDYDDTEEEWIGVGLFCACSMSVRLFCLELSAVWTMIVTIDGVDFAFNAAEPGGSHNCEPFYWITKVVSNDGCCDSVMAASQFHFEVTE